MTPLDQGYLSYKGGWLAGQQPEEGLEPSLRQHLGAKYNSGSQDFDLHLTHALLSTQGSSVERALEIPEDLPPPSMSGVTLRNL